MAASDLAANPPESPITPEPTPEPVAAPEAPATVASAPTAVPSAPPPAPPPPAADPNPPSPSPSPSPLPPPAAAPPSAPEEPPKPADPPHPDPEPPRSPEDRARAFHGAFEAETREAAWADEQEPGLRQLTAAAGVAAEDVADVACRRSVCKLTFKASQLPEGLEAALQARIKTEFGDTLLETHDPQSDKPAQLYVLRSGFPLAPPRPD